VIAALLQIGFALSLAAQTATGADSPTSRSYAPADFAQFAPKSALDMLQRVPGFSIREEDTDRGLGTASGNVLVNGQRISGKSNDVLSALSQISSKDVEHIDIVDGATLNIPGLTGQVANVIVRSTGIKGQWGYYPEFRSHYSDPRLGRFDISAGGAAGPVEYTIGLDNRANRSAAGGPTWIYNTNRSVIEERHDEWRSNSDRPRFFGKAGFKGGEQIANINVSYTHLMFDYLENGLRRSSDGSSRNRKVTIDEKGNSYEIGGDYEFGLGAGRLKLIGLSNGKNVPSVTDVVTTPEGAAATTIEGERFSGDGDQRETIGRAEYRWKRHGGDWQISGEGAFNRLDNTSHLFELRPGGVFEEVPLPGATARVSEDRYEVMGSWARPVTPKLTLNASAGGEYSRLSAGGPSRARTFYRPKGEFSSAYKISPRTDLNVKLARRVGQLNFFDFLASVNLRDDIRTAANPNLVPQQSWELDIESVRNLGAKGTMSLRLYGRLIDDIIDTIPIGETGQAPGNLDQAKVYGIESRSTVNLDSYGWRGARVDATFQVERSRVKDPLTGEVRPISNSLLHGTSASLRHDIPRSNFAWGTDWDYWYYAQDYRLTEVGRQWEGPIWGDIYVEHKNAFGTGLTVKGGIYNLISARSFWDRTVYNGRRSESSIAFIEHRDRLIGPVFSFSIRGKF
jgi:hypothetical protein